jgi:hypothetical protein
MDPDTMTVFSKPQQPIMRNVPAILKIVKITDHDGKLTV